MVPAVILVDDAGRPLRSAILQNDARATAEIRELAAALPGLDFVARTGSALTQQSVGPTLLWLARHEPNAWTSAATVQGSYDWLASRLGAAPHVERNWALESGLFELEKDGALTPLQPVRDALARLAGIKPDVIPPVADPGTVIGEVSRSAAAETGLRPGTPIVTGGADHVLSAYAAGLASPATGWSSSAARATSSSSAATRSSTSGSTWTPTRSPGSGCPTAAWPRPAR